MANSFNFIGRHVEELVRLPNSFLCYTPSPEAGPVCPAPALSNGFVTFGSFNNLAKVLIWKQVSLRSVWWDCFMLLKVQLHSFIH